MTYRQTKWLIILVPMLTIELWEFIRHAYLYPYMSMRMGNWLSAIIVLAVTLMLTVGLFKRMENLQEELNRERAEKAILVERERIARELHDGIAQSLFLVSVKLHKLEESSLAESEPFQSLKKTIRRVYDDVRQAIANLRVPPLTDSAQWSHSIQSLIQNFENDTSLSVSLDWDFERDMLTPKEKVEMTACLREALMNIRKHANASRVWIRFSNDGLGWRLLVEDDGGGISEDPFANPSCYGLRMMRERADEPIAKLQKSYLYRKIR
ncbi:sensor histidine kinase [Effusibacillus dendaii]|uniref:histidine kinase n=1 Tax=Effusibacillus dendaii TaxID=2743772 RepID=A0A7I8DDJ4_9BACL|nr:histidine kinase [Effusibacillus dendaii]BCJ88194.1 hypothetical protein skT53_31790 [Effusibacillus dendaii]